MYDLENRGLFDSISVILGQREVRYQVCRTISAVLQANARFVTQESLNIRLRRLCKTQSSVHMHSHFNMT